MKFILIFLIVLASTYSFMHVFGKRDRRLFVKTTGKLLIPFLISLTAVIAAVFVATSPTLKFL